MWRLRTLCLAGITALGMGLSGCVISDTDDQAFVLDWDLAYVSGGAVRCEDAGTPTVVLDAEHVHTKNKYSKSFPCNQKSGASDVWPLGAYNVVVSIRDTQGRPVSLIGGGLAEIHRHGLTDLGTIIFQIQTWHLRWSIARKTPAGPIGCAEAGGQTVQLITQLGSEPQERFTFQCNDREGITQAIRTGVYGVQAKLLGAGEKVLSETPVNTVSIGDQPQVIDVVFDVN